MLSPEEDAVNNEVTADLPANLRTERGMPGVGVAIWRKGQHDNVMQTCTVGEFLSRPENCSGEWLIDGGWGGPPGPLLVKWGDGRWIFRGWAAARGNR